MAHLGLRNEWLDLVGEGAEPIHEAFFIETDGVDGDFIVLPAIDTELLLEGDIDKAFKKLKAAGWRTDGWTKDQILKEVDPRFINHQEHFDKLLYGGTDKSGKHFKGGGGLRWGGLVVRGGEALLRVMGSLEYDKTPEIYQNTIRFANFGRIARVKDLNWPDKARLLLRDALKVHCDCPAFRYYYAYTAGKKGFGLYPEIRPAKVTNKKNRGAICKHLHVTLRWLGGQYSKMASELKQYYEKPKGK